MQNRAKNRAKTVQFHENCAFLHDFSRRKYLPLQYFNDTSIVQFARKKGGGGPRHSSVASRAADLHARRFPVSIDPLKAGGRPGSALSKFNTSSN
jgi:hypothetical protein